MTSISVVIPTRNRAAILPRTLNALAAQTLPSSDYEVIIVNDGCSDATTNLLRDFRAPYKLSFAELNPCQGAAAARNLGAARAQSELLLFLDDDMEAREGLLAAHVAAHQNGRGNVVLGYFPMQPPAPDDNAFTKAARLWWAEKFADRGMSGYRYTLKDFCTGNVSLPRQLFDRVRGFDESIDHRAAGEDYELGYRLIQSGARFYFAREAASVHHTRSSLSLSLRRAEQEGYGQTALVRRHPELFSEFNVSRLSRAADSTILRPFWKAIWAWPVLAAVPAFGLQLLVSVLARLEIYSLLWRFYGPLRGYAYWKGVRAVMGNLAVWERLNQDAPLEPSKVREIDLDLTSDLDKLELLFDSEPVDAVRVWSNGEPAGRISPLPGAEPLRAEHAQNILVKCFSGALADVLVQKAAGRFPVDSRLRLHPTELVEAEGCGQLQPVERQLRHALACAGNRREWKRKIDAISARSPGIDILYPSQ